jgi:hypothetical protein
MEKVDELVKSIDGFIAKYPSVTQFGKLVVLQVPIVSWRFFVGRIPEFFP